PRIDVEIVKRRLDDLPELSIAALQGVPDDLIIWLVGHHIVAGLLHDRRGDEVFWLDPQRSRNPLHPIHRQHALASFKPVNGRLRSADELSGLMRPQPAGWAEFMYAFDAAGVYS